MYVNRRALGHGSSLSALRPWTHLQLRDKLSSLKNGPTPVAPSAVTRPATLERGDTLVGNTLGTLTTGHGSSRYVGKLAGSEYLHQPDDEDESLEQLSKRHRVDAPVDPTTSPRVDRHNIRRHLPDWDREGRHLVEIYWSNVDWM